MKKLSLIGFLLLVLVVTGCGGKKVDYNSLEADLKKDVLNYYNENLKDMVIGVNQHKVTLSHLEASGVDISKYKDADCDVESYALVKLTLDDENNVVGEPVVENHLSCAGYTQKSE